MGGCSLAKNFCARGCLDPRKEGEEGHAGRGRPVPTLQASRAPHLGAHDVDLPQPGAEPRRCSGGHQLPESSSSSRCWAVDMFLAQGFSTLGVD